MIPLSTVVGVIVNKYIMFDVRAVKIPIVRGCLTSIVLMLEPSCELITVLHMFHSLFAAAAH